MVASSDYISTRSTFINEVAKYISHVRPNFIEPNKSIVNMVVNGVVYDFDAKAEAHEASNPTNEQDSVFYTHQTDKLLRLIKNVESVFIYEQDSHRLVNSDRFYLSGVPNPITQNAAASFTTQKFSMTTTKPVTTELALETTNIPAGIENAVIIAKYSTETDYFKNGGSTTINKGVWATELVVEKNTGDDYPLFYTEVVEVDSEGNDLGTPKVITPTGHVSVDVKTNGTYFHYLHLPEYTISSSLHRFQLRILAYSSANTTTLKYKIKGTKFKD